MPGGLLNLIGVGEANIILNGNPKKSFWKATYSKYTNFGLQKFRIDFKGQKILNLNESTKYSFTFPRHGDLIADSFLAFKLPHIWSPLFPTNNYNNEGHSNFIPYEFKWIENLGVKMISEIELTIGSQTIQKYSGDYLQSLIDRDYNTNDKSIIDEMVGNTTYFNDPVNYHSSRSSNNHTYPNAVFNSSPGGVEPSIRGKYLYIPLNLWFNLNTKQAFPLVSLQYNELTLNITIRPVRELYKIRNVTDPENNFNYVAPNFNDKFQQLYYFLQEPQTNINSDTSIIYNENDFFNSYINKRVDWDNDIHLISTYAFLDDQERELFARNNQSYLIKNIYENIFHNITETDKLELNSNGMVSSWMWFIRRNDVNLRNEWSNYTNWDYVNKNPTNISIPSNSEHQLDHQQFHNLPNTSHFLPPKSHEIIQHLQNNNKSISNIKPIWPQQGTEKYVTRKPIEQIDYLSECNENTIHYHDGYFYFNQSEYIDYKYIGLKIGTYRLNNCSNELITFSSNEMHKFTISGNIKEVKYFQGKQLYYYDSNIILQIHEQFTNLEMKNLTNLYFQENFLFVKEPPNLTNDISIIKSLNNIHMYVPKEHNLTVPFHYKITDKNIHESKYLSLKDHPDTKGIAAKIVLVLSVPITDNILIMIKHAFENVKWNIHFNETEHNNNGNVIVKKFRNKVMIELFYKIKILLQDNHHPISVHGLVQTQDKPHIVHFNIPGLNINDWHIDPVETRYYVNTKQDSVWNNQGGPESGISWNLSNQTHQNNLQHNFITKPSIHQNYWGSNEQSYGFSTSGAYNENYNKEILKNLTIIIDGKTREEKFGSHIYLYLESLLKRKGSYKEGLYFYNFQIKSDPFSIQPTGAMNLSKFKKIEFLVEVLSPPIKEETLYNVICNQNVNNESDILGVKKNVNSEVFKYAYNIHLFEERYNILTFTGGNAGLMYTL